MRVSCSRVPALCSPKTPGPTDNAKATADRPNRSRNASPARQLAWRKTAVSALKAVRERIVQRSDRAREKAKARATAQGLKARARACVVARSRKSATHIRRAGPSRGSRRVSFLESSIETPSTRGGFPTAPGLPRVHAQFHVPGSARVPVHQQAHRLCDGRGGIG